MTDIGQRTLVAIHGHLYQPPRQDPWTGDVAAEPSAAPFHDWNARIDSECYGPNGHAEFAEGRVNNYEHLSFDVGPTLTDWLADSAPDTLRSIVLGDESSTSAYGHGGAIAHPWVHAILPLCTPADATTLVRWGITEFEFRFGRRPEGMWLPETAMDIATLRILSEQGIGYTIAAPLQVMATRSDSGEWVAGAGDGRPVRISLGDTPGSDSQIIVVPYDGATSSLVAFGGGLNDGHALAQRIRERAADSAAVVVATDMESYGHHHRFGEMALAVAIDSLSRDPNVELVTVGEIVARLDPIDGVLLAPSAWSCAHGIERWRSDCGCRLGASSEHGQAWRAPLRAALDGVRLLVEQLPELSNDLRNPPDARDAYVTVLLDETRWSGFVNEHVSGDPVRARTWLELQRNLLLMYSSCGWFFDDAAGHETLIVLRHCRRAIELVIELGGPDAQPMVRQRLAEMVSDERNCDGAAIWDQLVHST